MLNRAVPTHALQLVHTLLDNESIYVRKTSFSGNDDFETKLIDKVK